MSTEKSCWICGSLSNSREHKFKKSDLVRRYGKGPFKGSIVHHYDDDEYFKNVPGPKSKIVKYDPVICSSCNNARSQPWDKAYKIFEKWIFSHSNLLYEIRYIPLELVYDEDENEDALYSQCVNLYKYFVKAFGCRLASVDIPVPQDLVTLLNEDVSVVYLKLSFSINRFGFALPIEIKDDFLGIGRLIGFGETVQQVIEGNKYEWFINVGWLRIWLFYNMPKIPCGVGAPWVADSACIYLGLFDSPSLEQLDNLIENARSKGTPEQLSNLEQIKKKLWG